MNIDMLFCFGSVELDLDYHVDEEETTEIPGVGKLSDCKICKT